MKNKESPIIKLERRQEYYDALAEKLETLQSAENDGRGIDCVKALILYLRKGMIREAKATTFYESDKFFPWGNINSIIKKELFEPGEKNPWSF